MGNRTVWIVLAVVAAAVLLCCCVLVVGIAVYGLAATSSGVREVTVGRVQERTEQRFAVDDAPVVEVVTFAGDVTLRAGSGGEVDVVVTKKAGGSTQLDRISVTVSETQDGVRIEATAPRSAGGYRSVDVDVTVPSDAQLALETGAGNIGVVDVAGSITAHTGAGNVEVEGGVGPVSLDTGAGEVDYAGDPQGDCTFSTGAGNVTLRLPAALDAEVELHAGIGNIELGGFDVTGEVSDTEVDGVIGSGEDATIEARTGAGNVELIQE